MYGDGRVMKRRLIEGKGDFPIDCPMEDCQVHFTYKARSASVGAKCESWAFDSKGSSDVLHVDLGEFVVGKSDKHFGCVKLIPFF